MCMRITAILAANDLDKARESYRRDTTPAAPAAAARGTIAQVTSPPDADASPVQETQEAR
jgi:hypothetical protein